MIYALGTCGRGSDELIDMIEAYIIKHWKALTTTDKDFAIKGFRDLNKGSDVLFEILGAETFQDLPKIA